jgi:hypothetical protein
MNKLIAVLLIVVLVSGCIGQTTPNDNDSEDYAQELSNEDLINEGLEGLDELENDLTDELDGIEDDLAQVNWVE